MVNITFKARLILVSTEIEVNNCLLYDFLTMNEKCSILSLLLLGSCSI